MVEAETRGVDCHDGDGGGGKGSYLGNNGRAKQTGLTDGLDGKYERKRNGIYSSLRGKLTSEHGTGPPSLHFILFMLFPFTAPLHSCSLLIGSHPHAFAVCPHVHL